MRQKSGPEKQPAEEAIKDIRRATRRYFSAEEKIRVVLEGLRGEESIAELCRRDRRAGPRSSGRRDDRRRRRSRLLQGRGIEACEKAGCIPHVPKPQRGSSVREGFFRKDEFRYDAERDAYACPAG